MKNKKFYNNADRTALRSKTEKNIMENFSNIFNKIKRINENEVSESNLEYENDEWLVIKKDGEGSEEDGMDDSKKKNVNELNLGQRALGVFDKMKGYIKNISKSGDGKEIQQGLKDLGMSTAGMTMYNNIGSRGDTPPEYTLSTANITNPKTQVKLNQNQIDTGLANSVFRAATITYNFSDNIPKLMAKVYYLNFETGKYDFIETKEENMSPEDIQGGEDVDEKRIKDETQKPVSISIEDLKTRMV